MVDIMKKNKIKLNELSKNIMYCNGDYRLYCIDVDDVIFNVAGIMQKILEKIDYRATNKFREEIAKETSADYDREREKHLIILNAILEETKCIVKKDRGQDEILDFTEPLIDYKALYTDKYLFPGVVENLNNIIENRGENEFFIFVSHRNPEREAIIKTERLYELFPEIDGVITLPFRENGKMTDKGLCVQQTLLLENLDNSILIDNSRSNCLMWRDRNGIDIRFLPEGFNERHTLSDHMTKLAVSDPYMLQFCLSYIEYSRLHPEYTEEIDSKQKVKKL